MAREVINVGAAPNDGQGDPIRTSFIKTNNNFGELYARAQENPPATLIGSTGDFAGMYAYDANFFYYCYADYDGSSTIWAEIPNTVIDAIEIVNGTSNVSIPTASGNVQIGVSGVGNLAVFSSTGATINGNFTVTGTGATINGDLTVTGNANLSGNITGDRIINGTTSIEIPVANGNATISIAGSSNVAVFSTSGLSVPANISGGNVILPTGARIFGDFSSSLITGQRTVFQTTSLSANGSTFVTAIPGAFNSNVIGAGAGFSVFANTDVANTTGIATIAFANRNEIAMSNVGTAVGVPFTVSFVSGIGEVARWTPGGNLGLGNTTPVDRLAVNGNVYVSNQIAASGLSITGTSTFAGNLMPAANITYNLGNATNRWNDIWLANSTIYLGNAQISANATGLSLATPVGGTLSVSGAGADVQTSGNITTTGGIFIGNGSGLTGVVATGNVGAASQLTNGTTSFNIPAADGNVVGNIGGFVNLYEFSTTGFSAAGNIAGNNISANTVTTSGNITSAGTFVGDGSGLVNVIANVGSAIKILSGTTEINIPVANGNIVANVAGSTNLFQWSTVGFSAQGNITGGNLQAVGLITAVGNVQGGNLRTNGTVTATGNVEAGNLNTTGRVVVSGTTAATSIVTGSIRTAGGLGLAGNVWAGGLASITGNVTGGNLVTGGVITATGNVTGGNLVTGGLLSVTGNVTGGNLVTGGVITAAGNVTGGNLVTGGLLSVTGNITAGNLSVNSGTVSVGAIVNNNANGVGNIGTTGTRFNTVFALASSAQYADLAEYYLADRSYPAGTVVAFGGDKELTLCDRDHDVTVAGILSDRPAFEMNAGIQGDNPVALALAGRVRCQVQGPVRRGQMLVSAGAGRARAELTPQMGAVIGKALQDFDGEVGTIEVVVGRL